MTWESSFALKAAAACDLAAKAAWTHPDGAASRAYFAVLAGLNARMGPPLAGRPRRHGDLRARASTDAVGLPRSDSVRITWLYELRLKADYQEKSVGEAQAAIAAEVAAAILATIGLPPP